MAEEGTRNKVYQRVWERRHEQDQLTLGEEHGFPAMVGEK
jgi:hypothetical protein